MLTLRHILDTTANGINQDWAVLYSTHGYEAVNRESADTTYIQSNVLNERSDFDCGAGAHPELGFVSAVTVHYRVRLTAAGGAPDMLIDALRAGAALSAGTTLAPTAPEGWVDGEYRIDVDAVSGARFTVGELDDLGIMVQVTTAPTAGYLQVSRVWLEIEWTLAPEFYDSVYHAPSLPNTILGDLAWNTTGAQAAALVGTQLRLTDTSAVDHRAYSRTILEYGSNYITEVSTRFNLTGSAVGFNYRAALVDDASYAVDLCCFTDAAGDPFVGLTTGGLDHDDAAAYFATYAVDWTNSHHYRVLIDRDADPGDSFNVRVFVDYDETPVMDVSYFKFTGTAAATIDFGTGSAVLQTGQIVANIDFIDWWHYRKSGSNWRYWHAAEEANNQVQVNTTDSQIAKPVTITPPGITTGQSPHCCALVVQDLTNECSIRTYVPVPSSLETYDVSLDYRIDTFAEAAQLLVQRTSDYYYWDNGVGVWNVPAAPIAVSYAPARTRVTLMTNITTPMPDNLIIRIRNDAGATLAHNIYLYKVDIR